ncbi:MAG TPA: hypothetical protein PLJ84_08570 [Bacteroidales bacterium]|nr:hypothetical protein [Bacteroidales bacterium]HPT02640.1 hypothetical protein [Bacteroidales bacterium]
MKYRLLTWTLLVFLLCSGLTGFSRAGLKICSAGNHLSWDDPAAWRIVQNGTTGAVTPQGDDTIMVRHEILMYNNFELNTGKLIIEKEGSLLAPGCTVNISSDAAGECSGRLEVLNLTVKGSASFLLMPEGKVTVNGLLHVDAGALFTLQDSKNKQGSLITYGPVEGNVSAGYSVPANENLLVSSPVSGAESGVFLNMYLRNYNEQKSGWGEYIVPTTVPLNPMQGYEVLSTYEDYRNFTGVPLSGEQKIAITSDGDGWNLVGNPYPSSIDWSLLGNGYDHGDFPPGMSTIYYWDPSGSGNFSVFCAGEEPICINNGSPVVHPMQGFFVKAGVSGEISTTNKMRIHAEDGDFVAPLPLSALKFKIEGNNFSDEAVVRFNPDASGDFDIAYDAYELQGFNTAPGIYTTLADGSKLAINTLGSVSSGSIIPIDVIIPYAGISVIKVQGASAFEFRYPVYLEDESTGIYTDLRADSVYSFESENGDPVRHFKLHFALPGGIQENETNTISVTAGGSAIDIKDAEGRSGIIEVFTVDGKRIFRSAVTSLAAVKIPVSPGRVYITRIETGEKVETCKLYCY